MQKEIKEGVYLLRIYLSQKKIIKIGALGEFEFPEGYYFYAGSAQRNLPARIKRHYSEKKNFHWHIDYLLDKSELVDDFVFQLPKKGECFLTELMLNNRGRVIVTGFGASDCRCESHLVFFRKNFAKLFIDELLYNIDVNLEFKEWLCGR
ncbi:MAG: GIY-YIG nuclease family protein [Bacillota bacterium]